MSARPAAKPKFSVFGTPYVASEGEAVALHADSSPLTAPSPYHAFARCPPTVLRTPQSWPGPRGSTTTVRLLWSPSALYVCWELEGVAKGPLKPSQFKRCVLDTLVGAPAHVPPEQRTVLLDDRVGCLLRESGDGQVCSCIEVNYDGTLLGTRAPLDGGAATEGIDASAHETWTKEMAVGWGGSSSPVPSAVAGLTLPFKRVVIGAFGWGGLKVDAERQLQVCLYRVENPALPGPGADGEAWGQAEVDQLRAQAVRTTAVDPGDGNPVLHRPELFGKLTLAPAGSEIDCSCCAARLLASRTLRVLPSPVPSLEECPPGALVVKGKYASLCGSDLPYFRDMESKGPSCYWDRDGFCGHEVIGHVIASKSDHFQPGDPVMSLPSSYFKAHAGSKQEWYREEVHGVLLQDFPVRGGFSEVYTSHELYSYKLRECVPRMLAAQGLGTVLRMARKIGPVLGKTVVVLGLGQNGLLATRLVAQLCAKHVIAVDPLEYRRKLALGVGATAAVCPEDASSAIAEVTSQRGADVVLEMVGHNQGTINDALNHVACSGIVAAFGVPDDKIYHTFEYSLFFRKNVQLIASVIPDPGVDFPEAIRLIEQNRFSTEGIFSHTLPLAELQRAFTIASDYQDGVVKLVVELS